MRTLIAAECIGDGYCFMDKVTKHIDERLVFDRGPSARTKVYSSRLPGLTTGALISTNVILSVRAEHVLACRSQSEACNETIVRFVTSHTVWPPAGERYTYDPRSEW